MTRIPDNARVLLVDSDLEPFKNQTARVLGFQEKGVYVLQIEDRRRLEKGDDGLRETTADAIVHRLCDGSCMHKADFCVTFRGERPHFCSMTVCAFCATELLEDELYYVAEALKFDEATQSELVAWIGGISARRLP